MKRILSLAFLLSAFAVNDLKADNRDFFDFEIDEVNTELAQVEELDQFLDQNENVTFADLEEVNSPLISNLSDQAVMSPAMAKRHRVLGIPSWIWGCVFGFVGIGIVYFVSENKDETKEALWGCVGGTLVGVLLYFLLIASVVGGAASTI